MWPQPLNCARWLTLPFALTFTRFAVPRWVLILGTGDDSLRFFYRGGRFFVFFRLRIGFIVLEELRGTHGYRARGQDHEHIFAFELRVALDDRDREHICGHAIEQALSEARIRYFATAEHDGDLHLAAVEKETFGHAGLGLVIVGLDLRAKL